MKKSEDEARAAWLKERRKGIGGSDIAAICGLSPWATPFDVYLSKTGMLPDEQDKDWLYWGRVLENVIADEYAKQQNVKIRKIKNIIRHKKYSHRAASIDRAIIANDRGKGILECKTANTFMGSEWGHEDSENIPVWYKAQIQWYLGVTGWNYADVAVLIGGQIFKTYQFEPDRELILEMFEMADDFWYNHVVRLIPPPLETVSDVVKAYPFDDGGSVVTSQEVADARQRLSEIKKIESSLAEEKKRLQFRVEEWMGQSSTLIGVDGKKLATWKRQESTRVDVNKLRKQFPDVYKQVIKTTDSRVLRITGAKK